MLKNIKWIFFFKINSRNVENDLTHIYQKNHRHKNSRLKSFFIHNWHMIGCWQFLSHSFTNWLNQSYAFIPPTFHLISSVIIKLKNKMLCVNARKSNSKFSKKKFNKTIFLIPFLSWNFCTSYIYGLCNNIYTWMDYKVFFSIKQKIK